MSDDVRTTTGNAHLDAWRASAAQADDPPEDEAPGDGSRARAPEHSKTDTPIVEAISKRGNSAGRHIPTTCPDALREIRAWLCWKFEPNRKGGKDRKVPYFAAGGRRAGTQGSSEDRRHMVTFDQAVAAAKRRSMDGIGFAAHQDHDVVVVDFDACIVNGKLHRDVAAVCQSSYAERSPSGEGVHLIVQGRLTNGKDHPGPGKPFGVELFSSSGFTTFTGDVLPLTDIAGLENTIAPADEALLQLVETRFKQKASEPREPRESNGEPIGLTPAQFAAAFAVLDPDMGYADWLRVGLATHAECGGSDEGLGLWDDWSSYGSKYPGPEALRTHWNSFGRTSGEIVTALSLVKMANDNGAGIEIHALAAADEFVDLSVAEPEAATTTPLRPLDGGDLAPRFPEPFPGPMCAAVDAALRAAPKPQPDLTTLAVLVGMAAGCHGSYHLPSGMRPNLYAVGAAETGAGKDLPRKAAIEMATAAGARIIGKPASGQGLEDALEDRRGLLTEMDEIGHVLATVNAKNAPGYQVELEQNLLKLYSAGSNTYNTRVRAKARTTTPARTISNPALSLIGFATPQTLGAAVGASNVANGLLGRMLFVAGDDNVDQRRTAVSFALPDDVAKAAGAIRSHFDALDFGDPDQCVGIEIEPVALQRLDALMADFARLGKRGTSAFEKALRVRSYEKCERIAGVLAVWDAPTEPVVQLCHVEWAARAVLAADAALVRFVADFMHEGLVQEHAARVASVMRRILKGDLLPDRGSEQVAIKRGLVPRALALKRTKLSKTDMDRAVEHLQATGEVLVVVEKSEAAKGGERAMSMLRFPDAG